MSKINLKPCPFCGGEAQFINYTLPTYNESIVRCSQCHSATSGFQFYPEKEKIKDFSEGMKGAANLWNIRAQTLTDCPAPVQKLKNERGAGRKPKITEETKGQIKSLSYLPVRYLAKEFDVSVGTVHNLISEHKKTG